MKISLLLSLVEGAEPLAMGEGRRRDFDELPMPHEKNHEVLP